MHASHPREVEVVAARIESAYRPDRPPTRQSAGRIVTAERLPALIFDQLAAAMPHLFPKTRSGIAL